MLSRHGWRSSAAAALIAAGLAPAPAGATSQALLISDAPAHVAGLTRTWASLQQRFGFSDVRIAVAGSSHEVGEDLRQFLAAPGKPDDLRLVWIAGPGADAANSVCPAWSEDFVRPQVPTILVAPSCLKFLVQAPSTYEQVAAADPAAPPPGAPGVVFINTSGKPDDDPPELASALATSPEAGGDDAAARALIAALGCAPKAQMSLDFSPSSSAWHVAPPLCADTQAAAEPEPAAEEATAPPPADTAPLPMPPPPRPDTELAADVPQMPAVPPVPVAASPLPEPGAPGFTPPVAGAIVSDFGSPAGGKANKGLDYEVPAGSAVKAAEAGEVVYVGELPGYGKVIAIKHGNEWATVYGHTSDVSVTKGQLVAKGQDIAHVDPAGNRLHFEIRRRGKPVDPRTMMASANP